MNPPAHQQGIAHLLLLVLAAIGLLVYLLITSILPFKDKTFSGLYPKSPSQASQQNKEDLQIKTIKLLKLSEAYQKDGNPAILAQLKEEITQRKQLLLSLIDQDPQFVARTALSSSLRQTFPSDLQNNLEKEVNLEGNLQVLIGDDFDKKEAKTNYSLKTADQGSLKLYFVEDPPAVNSDTKVQVKGLMLADKVVIGGKKDMQILEKNNSVLGTMTTKRVAIILMNFQNDASQPYSQDNLRTEVFTSYKSANNFYKEASFGKISVEGKLRVDGDVFGWYTIPYNNNPCDGYAWVNAANTKAQAAGVDLSGYTNYVYIHPNAPGCNVAAGEIGGSKVWVGGVWRVDQLSRVIAHELGHNFGAGHANSYTCYDSSGQRVPISTNCTSGEYGDPFDLMGGGEGGYQHPNVYHKGMFSWWNTASTQAVTSSGTYNIAPLETLTNSTQVLRIPRTSSDYYYLEYRQPGAIFDQFTSPYNNIYQGVSIRVASTYNTRVNSQLIDTTPTSGNGFADAVLLPGQTFQDNTAGLGITVNSLSANNASVQITLGGNTCSRAKPTVSVSPQNLWGTAGQTLTYTLSVKNNDSPACFASAFSISPSLPSGWTQSASPGSLTISPGSTATATLSITSSSNSAAGYYTFTQSATNTSSNSYSSSASANYNISSVVTNTSGLQGTYFDNLDFTGTSFSRVDPQINFSWGTSSPDSRIGPETFSVRWTGFVQPLYSQTYTFYTQSDDGVRLWVNNQLVVDNWTDHSLTENSGAITLQAGQKYPLKMEFYDNGVDAIAQLFWSSSSQSKQVIPSSQLYPSGGTSTPTPTSGSDDNISPAVSITSPGNGATVSRSSTVSIQAAASDNIGISKVEFYVNGGLKCSDTLAAYSCNWKVSGKPNASYNLTAKAYDTSGNTSSNSITVIAR